MRLLNVHTLEFQVFPTSEDRPPYVVTSHRWIGEEITYQQFCSKDVQPGITKTTGFQKVLNFCEFIRQWGADLSCPSRDSTTINIKGDCEQCFKRKYQCDQERPTCSNCQHHGLGCQYYIPPMVEDEDETKPPIAGSSQEPEQPKRGKQKKSCKACAIENNKCSKDYPTCARCEKFNLTCDYETALTAILSRKDKHKDVKRLDWVWIDTCCIDKSSSMEVAEAITSMFKYYAESFVCLAYLQDVRSRNHAPSTILLDLQKCSWFTRGWTLQELIAPALVVFLSQNWEVLGHKAGSVRITPQMKASKVHMPLNNALSQISGIPEKVLLDYSALKKIAVKTRLGWGKSRTTARPEDKAYCLLGICDVFMPLMYGEGDRAFGRLEDTIKKESDNKEPVKKKRTRGAADDLFSDNFDSPINSNLPPGAVPLDDFNDFWDDTPAVVGDPNATTSKFFPPPPADFHDVPPLPKRAAKVPVRKPNDDDAIDSMMSGRYKRDKEPQLEPPLLDDEFFNDMPPFRPDPVRYQQNAFMPTPLAPQFGRPLSTHLGPEGILYDWMGRHLSPSRFPRLYGVYEEYPERTEARLRHQRRHSSRGRRDDRRRDPEPYFSPFRQPYLVGDAYSGRPEAKSGNYLGYGDRDRRDQTYIASSSRSTSRPRSRGRKRSRDPNRACSVTYHDRKDVRRLEEKMDQLYSELRAQLEIKSDREFDHRDRIDHGKHSWKPQAFQGIDPPFQPWNQSNLPSYENSPLAMPPRIDERKYRWVLEPLVGTTDCTPAASIPPINQHPPAATLHHGPAMRNVAVYDGLGRVVSQPRMHSLPVSSYPKGSFHVAHHPGDPLSPPRTLDSSVHITPAESSQVEQSRSTAM